MKGWALAGLAYSATGVIFGDIATSPLYVYPSVFASKPSQEDLMGALCLIFWTLTSIGLLKYVGIVLYANDDGEGRPQECCTACQSACLPMHSTCSPV